MAFPLLPLLLLGGLGAGAAVLISKSSSAGGGSDKIVTQHGVEYGPGCTYVKMINPTQWAEYAAPIMVKMAEAFDPDMLAIKAVSKLMKAVMPGPGCSYSTDGSFDTTFIALDGSKMTWLEVRTALGEKTLMQAHEDGSMDNLGISGKQGSSGSMTVDAIMRLLGV